MELNKQKINKNQETDRGYETDKRPRTALTETFERVQRRFTLLIPNGSNV